MSYVYVEYPKCLYQVGGGTLVVENEEEETNAAAMGWLTAEKFNSKAEEPKGEEPKVEENVSDSTGSIDESIQN